MFPTQSSHGVHGAMSRKHWKCTGRQSTVPNGVRPRIRILYSPDFKLSVQPKPCLFPQLVCVGEGVRKLDCARRVRNWQARPTSHRPNRQQSKLHPLAPFSHLTFPPPLLHVSPIYNPAKPRWSTSLPTSPPMALLNRSPIPLLILQLSK